MSLSDSKEEFLSFTENERLIIFIVTRIVCIIGFFPFILLFIVYCKRSKNFTIFMVINSQLCISQLIGNASNFYPMIDTKKLEDSALCKIQAIQTYISSFSRDILIFVIMLITYLNYLNPQKVNAYSKLIIWITTIGCWAFSITASLLYLLVDIASSASCLCRPRHLLPRFLKYGFFYFSSIVSNVFVFLLLCEMKKQIHVKEDKKYWKKFLKKFIILNIPVAFELVVVIGRTSKNSTVNSHSFPLSLALETTRDLVRIFIVIAFCFNERVRNELGILLCCKKNSRDYSSLSSLSMDVELDDGSRNQTINDLIAI